MCLCGCVWSCVSCALVSDRLWAAFLEPTSCGGPAVDGADVAASARVAAGGQSQCGQFRAHSSAVSSLRAPRSVATLIAGCLVVACGAARAVPSSSRRRRGDGTARSRAAAVTNSVEVTEVAAEAPAASFFDQLARSFFPPVGELQGLLHQEEPAGRLFYGPRPVGVQSATLSDELRQYLELALPFAGAPADKGDMERHGFHHCVDYPDLPEHVYFEASFHTLPAQHAVVSAHPRDGRDYLKPAAPLPLRAFAEAVRRSNKSTLAAMAVAAPAGSLVRGALERGGAFGDVAIQVHLGDAVAPEQVSWHIDAPNSAVHMAVSLLGSRTLHMKVRRPDAYDAAVLSEVQRPGDVYVGNPVSYCHGVEYPGTQPGQCIVACQFRLLLTEAELRSKGALDGVGDVAHIIADQHIAMPSLKDVLAVAAELEQEH